MKQKHLWLFLLEAALIFCALLPAQQVQAAGVVSSGNCGVDANWTLTYDGTLTISGSGRIRNYNTVMSAPWYSHRNIIKSLVIEEGIVSVGNYAFYLCENLESITLPDSLRLVGESAFAACHDLTQIHINDLANWCRLEFDDSIGNPLSYGATLYEQGVPVEDLAIPEGVTSIGNYAFAGYHGIYELVIPEHVTSIGSGAFADCENLHTVVLPDSITEIESDVFAHCQQLVKVTFPAAITSVGSGAFAQCARIKEITIPNTVTHLGSDVFKQCHGLLRVTIPGSVKEIGDNAFQECVKLVNITISEGVTRIGNEAFTRCDQLRSITIPGSVVSIGDSAFANCSLLFSVILEEGVTEIEDWAFNDCKKLEYISIPSTLTTIGIRAFLNCTSLKQVHIKDLVAWCNIDFDGYDGNPLVNGAGLYLQGKPVQILEIPQGIRAIKKLAFYGCGSITDVRIPEGVTEIGNSAFRGCPNLVSVTIASSVTKIGNGVFYRCEQMKHVLFTGTQAQWDNIEIGNEQQLLLDATRHDSCGSEVITVTRTCAGDTYHCSLCNADFHTQKNMESHTWDDGKVTQAATCEIAGIRTYTCTSCGIQKTQNIVRTTDHVWLTGDVMLPATCREPGAQTKFCKLCGISESEILPQLPNHSWDRGKVSREATCKQVGTIIYTCSACHGTKTEFIPKLTTHTYNNGVCGVCKQIDPSFTGTLEPVDPEIPVEDLLIDAGTCGQDVYWTLDSEGTLRISGNGAMRNYTFNTMPWYVNKESVHRVEIQEGVTSIGQWAFVGCSLTDVTIPASVTRIGSDAFGDYIENLNVHITDLSVWCQIIFMNEKSTPLFYQGKLYLDGEPVTELIIPDDVTAIRKYAFAGCENLTSLTVPKNVSIGEKAFYSCGQLTDVTLHEGVEIQADAFYLCSRLKNLTISEGIKSIGDRAFTFCYGLTELKLPSTITTMGKEAFSSCDGLTSISIPNGVTVIEDRLFYSCDSLTQVTLPVSITHIGERAFEKFPSNETNLSLETIRYAGSQEQWNDIEIHQSNAGLITVQKQYNYVYPDGSLDGGGGVVWWIWLIAVGGVALAGSVAFVVIFKKTKKV